MSEVEKLRDGIIAGPRGVYSFYENRDTRIHGWLKEALSEGDRLLHLEPGYDKIDRAMDYIGGDQITGNHPSYLHKVVVNQTRKAVRTHVSALTDIEPLFEFKTKNQNYERHADLLNQRAVVWWVQTFADLELADCIKYALAAGSGDMVIEYDRFFNGGDTRLIPRDCRDTIAIRPERTRSLQDWEGLTIRETHSPNKLKAHFPEYASEITEDSGVLGRVFTRFRRNTTMNSPSGYTLDGLGTKSPNSIKGITGAIPEATLYRTFINDRAINLTGGDVLMGPPGTNWCYTVKAGERLYPYRRLILWNERRVLWDGPSPYAHGYYPVSRLCLERWPWLQIGLGLVHDLMPINDAINTTVNDFLQVFSQWVNRGSVWDKNMPEAVFKRFDPRMPNWKIKKNSAFADGFALQEGPQLPPWAFQFLQGLFAKFDELSETGNLAALMQLRQSPGADTLDKYMEALTPGIRLEARQMEAFLREVAEQWKGNLFQFESKAKRFMILGEAGQTLADIDADPDTLIPALSPTDPGYTPELDLNLPRQDRAKFFMMQFSFMVAPNSMLAMKAQETKLTYVQLSRQGYVDFKTLLDILNIPNVGDYPPVPLPPVNWKPDPNDPTRMPVMVPRQPITIIERLMAQQQLGIGQTVSPAGRKASGSAPPALVARPDGSSTVTES